MVVWKKKSHARAEAIDTVCSRTARLGLELPGLLQQNADDERPFLPAFSWEGDLDPAAGELDAGRAERKRQQICSAAMHALELAHTGAHVVELGVRAVIKHDQTCPNIEVQP